MKASRRILVALATLLVALGAVSLAQADPAPTTVRISENAQYANSGQITLQVVISCTPGYGYSVQASVVQPAGWSQMFGNGYVSGACSGQQQKLAVPVYSFAWPGWQLGDAVASVTTCAASCTDDTKAIHIVL
jgi:hypothetical protein